MIPKGLFTQIGLIGLAVAIVFTYIKPELSKIASVQDTISIYQIETDKVSEVNGQLSAMVRKVEGVSVVDQRKLVTYIPDYIDTIIVPRDLEAISREAGVLFNGVGYEGAADVVEETDEFGVPIVSTAIEPMKHTFGLSVQGSYTQIKQLLSLLEQNAYPLEIQDLTMSPIEGGFLTADMQIITYSHVVPKSVNVDELNYQYQTYE